MERFKFYGELEKITSGDGILQLGDGKEYNVSFEIAKRGEEKLLFSATCKDDRHFESINQDQHSGKSQLNGTDKLGRNVNAIDLLIKDTETNTEGDTVFNGYVRKCEIGEKVISDDFVLKIDMINFLFLGNETIEKKTDTGKTLSRSILQLQFPDFDCSVEQIKNYSIVKQLLKRQGGVLNTSTISTKVCNLNDYDSALEKVRKLCQLLSVARSTFINWGSCRVCDNAGDVIYEFHGNAFTKPYHGNNLIDELPAETENFLNCAWNNYDKFKEIFDLERFLYGYADTYMNSYIETRCLNIAALTDGIGSRLAIDEEREVFLDENEFNKKLPELKEEVEEALKKAFGGKIDKYSQVMVSKVFGFNRRPLNWKLNRLSTKFDCPISDKEINRFVNLRDHLAHSSLFPDDEDSVNAFLFMRHFLDRVVLSVLGYSGKYFDMENMEEKVLTSN